MLSRFLLKTSLLLPLFVFPGPSYPQAENENSYLVEILVFKNIGADTSNNELWGRNADIELGRLESSEHSVADHSAVRFVGRTTLDKLAAEIQASGSYELLKRLAWVQPSSKKDLAPTVSIESGGVLSGTLRFYENQLLFVELDLRFNRPLTSIRGTTVPYSSRYYRTADFRIKETRRVKINEVHYFDHPYFGALVKASRWSRTP